MRAGFWILFVALSVIGCKGGETPPEAQSPTAPKEAPAQPAEQPEQDPGATAGQAANDEAAAHGADAPAEAPPTAREEPKPAAPEIPLCDPAWGAAAERCGTLAGAELAPVQPLLDGRLHLNPLPGAIKVPKARSIMGADEADTDETRLFLEKGQEKFVIMAYEPYNLWGEDFTQAIHGIFAPPEGEKHTVCRVPLDTADDTVQRFAVTPLKLNLSGEAVLVLRLFVGHPDGSMQRVDFFVNPQLAQEEAGCISLARRIASSLSLGPKRLDKSARQAVVTGTTIALPAEWVISLQKGPDFEVHQIKRFVPLGMPQPLLAVYKGRHPRRIDTEGDVRRVPVTLGGQETEWILREQPAAEDRSAWHSGDVVYFTDHGLATHLFYGTPPAYLSEVQAMLAHFD